MWELGGSRCVQNTPTGPAIISTPGKPNSENIFFYIIRYYMFFLILGPEIGSWRLWEVSKKLSISGTLRSDRVWARRKPWRPCLDHFCTFLEINATRKVTFQVALFGKDHPKNGLATYCRSPNNNASREATVHVAFQAPEFPNGFLRYDNLLFWIIFYQASCPLLHP